MKWFRDLQHNSITSALAFLLFLITSNGVLDYYSRLTLKQHETVANEVKEVQLTMQQILRKLNACDLGFRGYYILPTEQMLEPYTKGYQYLSEPFDKIRAILSRQGLDDRDLQPIEQSIGAYFALTAQMILWRQEDNLEEIKAVMATDPGGEVWHVFKKHNEELEQKQEAILLASQASTEKIMAISTSLRIVLFALGIPTLLIVLLRLRRERLRRMKLFQELDEQNRVHLFNPNTAADNSVEEKQIIHALISNLNKASAFIQDIGKGNFDICWEGLGPENQALNRHNLAGELLRMKDQMQQVKQEDQKRLWATEGLSLFAQLVRQHQHDIQSLTDKITATAARYMGANQASLFFAEKQPGGETMLRLYGCYAYDRKKWIEKTIAPGQGLVGQTYLEKEITYLTDIPQHYVHITSGLGEATPSALVVVPLMFNEQVEGILEIASFKKFEAYELDFLQKVGEIIASAILSMKTAAEMKALMESLQSQSEELQAQEEEMRQNMEELQATQEEMSRKAREYQQMIAERDATLARLSNAPNH